MDYSLLKKYRDRMCKQFTSYLLPFLMNTNTSETTWSNGLAQRLAGTRQLWYYFFFLGNLPPPHFILIFLLFVYSSALVLSCYQHKGLVFSPCMQILTFGKSCHSHACTLCQYMHGHSDYRNASCSNSASV